MVLRLRLGAAKLATTGNKAALVERLLPAPSSETEPEREDVPDTTPESEDSSESSSEGDVTTEPDVEAEPPPRPEVEPRRRRKRKAHRGEYLSGQSNSDGSQDSVATGQISEHRVASCFLPTRLNRPEVYFGRRRLEVSPQPSISGTC